ncbi:MAG TPA: hypothetical protein VF221_07485 [Chloroflexota bacterium]
MNVAVGRMQLTLTLAEARPKHTHPPMDQPNDRVERTYRRERALSQAEADRMHWADSTLARGGWVR